MTKAPTILHGNNLDVLPTLPDASIDAIVTDPPYELAFMGRQWDASGIAYSVDLWRECLRVLKPGGYLLAFGATRTYHRMTCAIEDAGFEIRDSLHWLYGSGFPKSLDISKAIDRAAGAEREIIGTRTDVATRIYDNGSGERLPSQIPITAPATPEAVTWQGWGTALKPAHEPIVLARRPIPGTTASNVLKHGTGALNIDGTRVGSDSIITHHTVRPSGDAVVGRGAVATGEKSSHFGRWPANVLHDGSHQVVQAFPFDAGNDETTAARYFAALGFSDLDSASFIYCPKASSQERNAGLEHLPKRPGGSNAKGYTADMAKGLDRNQPVHNFHPTVKPLALMRWLIRLVTPKGGTVLDPFAGSGTTLAAAILESKHAIGIELTADYLPIIKARTEWAYNQVEGTLFADLD